MLKQKLSQEKLLHFSLSEKQFNFMRYVIIMHEKNTSNEVESSSMQSLIENLDLQRANQDSQEVS